MSWQVVLVVVAGVAAAQNAGAFFAFSNFVMPALDALPADEGARAMQSINRFAPNPLFVACLVGAGGAAAPVVITDWGAAGTVDARWVTAGAGLSVLSLVVTMTCNVPRNNALDVLDADGDAASTVATWRRYVTGWTRWNTARTVASSASVAAYALSLRGR